MFSAMTSWERRGPSGAWPGDAGWRIGRRRRGGGGRWAIERGCGGSVAEEWPMSAEGAHLALPGWGGQRGGERGSVSALFGRSGGGDDEVGRRKL